MWEEPSGKEPATFVDQADSNRFSSKCVCMCMHACVKV